MTHADVHATRAREVAEGHNAGLPAPARAAILAEELRVGEQVLAPRGLAARHVLVVGGAGYIGTAVTAHLLDRGYRVRCLDLLLYGNGECVAQFLPHPGYEFQRGDLARAEDAALALDGVTDVVLLGALVGDPVTRKYPDQSRAINEAGTARFIAACNGRGLNKLVFVSTCSNYGLIEGDHVADENWALQPLSLYASAKVASETTLLGLHGRVDHHATVLRFATAFGLSARMRFDLTVNEFTREMFLARPLTVFDADTWRPYCHVRDFARLIRRVLEAPAADVSFEVFNGGGDANNLTKRTIVQEIARRLPQAPVLYQEHGSDPRNYRVTFAKVRERLFFEPEMGVGDGIDELLTALRDGRFGEDVERSPNLFGNYELDYVA